MTQVESRPGNSPFPINEKLAGLVPMASAAEQAALTEDIRAHGLRTPVVLWRGKVIDGRCRMKACEATGHVIRANTIDDTVTEKDAEIIVKSLNTRRNLTITQKIISACKESMKPGTPAIHKIATSWGISPTILKNAKYIAKQKPEFIDILFNGGSVPIISGNGTETTSVKISAIYAFLRKEEEKIVEDTQFGWSAESFIRTQAGKEYYFNEVKRASLTGNVAACMLIAELANYKFTRSEES